MKYRWSEIFLHFLSPLNTMTPSYNHSAYISSSLQSISSLGSVNITQCPLLTSWPASLTSSSPPKKRTWPRWWPRWWPPPGSLSPGLTSPSASHQWQQSAAFSWLSASLHLQVFGMIHTLELWKAWVPSPKIKSKHCEVLVSCSDRKLDNCM